MCRFRAFCITVLKFTYRDISGLMRPYGGYTVAPINDV